MGLIDYIKKWRQKKDDKPRAKEKEHRPMVYVPEQDYEQLIQTPKIQKILQTIPKNLSKMEQAYYVYIELGKIVNQSVKFELGNVEQKYQWINEEIEETKYEGICKSISELYIAILAKLDIKGQTIKRNVMSPVSHVDVILSIDHQSYLVNLILDLNRIKTARKTKWFAPDLEEYLEELEYLYRIEQEFGYLSHLEETQKEEMDEKIGYAYIGKKQKRIYTDDVMSMLKKEFQDKKLLEQYVFHGKKVPKEEQLEYKVDYIIENLEKMIDFQGEIGYLTYIEQYQMIFDELLSESERKRLRTYVTKKDANPEDSTFLLVINPSNRRREENKNKRTYYMVQANEKPLRIEKKQDRELLTILQGMSEQEREIRYWPIRKKDIDTNHAVEEVMEGR